MKAITVNNEAMSWSDTETPTPKSHEVRIRVKATAVNRADLLQRRGLYPPPPGASEIMGLECAGIIDSVGAEVSQWQVGDSVCALLAGGGYAEQVCVDQGSVLNIPTSLSFAEAAALPEVFATAWLNLYQEAQLQSGEKVIIHAGASGVGTAGIQLCQQFGNPCFITAGSEEKIQRCLALGADAGFNRHAGDFYDSAKAFAGDQGIGVILDPVGGQYLSDNLKLLSTDGRLVLIGLMGGAKAEIPLGLLLSKRLKVIGSTLRARSHAAKRAVMQQLQNQVWPLIETKKIQPIIEKRFNITEVEAAHDLVAGNTTFGKVVLEIPD